MTAKNFTTALDPQTIELLTGATKETGKSKRQIRSTDLIRFNKKLGSISSIELDKSFSGLDLILDR